MTTQRRVDVHTHYLADALASALEARTELPRITRDGDARAIDYGHGNGHDLLPSMVDLDVQLAEMDAAGIDLAVLTVNVPGVDWFDPADGVAIARDVNDELAEISRANPERFAALALLPMQAPEAAADELERAVSAGLRGAVVYSNIAGAELDAGERQVVFDTAGRLDVPVMIHPTYPLSAAATDAYALIPTVGFLVDTTMAALRVIFAGLYERNPDFKLHLCHAASLLPQIAGRIDYEATRFPGGTGKLEALPSERISQLYTDTVCVWEPALRSAIALVGAERMMFGSDYPFWRSEATIEMLDGADIDGELRSAIESENAIRFYGL